MTTGTVPRWSLLKCRAPIDSFSWGLDREYVAARCTRKLLDTALGRQQTFERCARLVF